MPRIRNNKWYGWKRDLPDKRDLLYKLEAEVIPESNLPSKIDLRPNISVIYNQGSLGSCTANAIAGGINYIQKDFLPSRLFIYYNERIIENSVNSDNGAQIRDGIKTVTSDGVCPENEWEYIISKFKQKPPKQCYIHAKKHMIKKYLRVNGLAEIKSSLVRGFPVVFGFSVYNSFESETVAKTGMVSMPTDSDSLIGGHAVICVGYDDDTQRIIVQNSWGKSWGMSGYFVLPYTYISPSLVSDCWTIRG